MAFVDPVALMVAYLDPIVSPVPVAVRVPADRPDRFLQVRRIGGIPVKPVRETFRFDLRAWDADSEPDAMALLLSARTAVWALNGNNTLGVTVYDVTELMGPRNDTDPDTGTPIAWCTPELTIRADDVVTNVPAPTP